MDVDGGGKGKSVLVGSWRLELSVKRWELFSEVVIAF